MARRSQRQLALPAPRSWGGRRVGAGRTPAPGRPRMGHDRRAEHDARHPVLLTLRAAADVPSLRSIASFVAIRKSIARLTRGIRGLVIRIALAIKRVAGVGKVWGDRYHARELETPTEVRHAIAYVLLNFRKHLHAPPGVDPRSSGPWFDGWAQPRPPAPAHRPTSRPRTWLASTGWRRAGLIDVREGPKPSRKR